MIYVKEELDLGDRSDLVFGLLAVCISSVRLPERSSPGDSSSAASDSC
ncbi:MAG: hypothetical protein R2839_05810 [Thermomicrobiales bacterium]